MGTVIKLSDGEQIFLNSDRDGVVMGIAEALDQDSVRRQPTGGYLPRGFLTWHDGKGDQVVVNAAQIVSVKAAEASSWRPAGND